MWVINQIGYLPGYSGHFNHGFTKLFPKKVSICFDNVYADATADINVLVQCEPPALYLDFWQMVQQHHTNYDLILAYDPRILTLPNSQEFCPVGTWVDSGLILDKKDQITFLMSSKIWTKEHRMRFMIMDRFGKKTNIGPFDWYWHRSPPRVADKNSFFTNAKFHIVTENQVMPNMYSEKLLDCFATKTVPIYYGCTNIDKYFNINGILQFNTIEELEKIFDNLQPDDYNKMLPYIEENYNLSRPYWENSIHQRIESLIEGKFFNEN
jgi:hypothetical protein